VGVGRLHPDSQVSCPDSVKHRIGEINLVSIGEEGPKYFAESWMTVCLAVLPTGW